MNVRLDPNLTEDVGIIQINIYENHTLDVFGNFVLGGAGGMASSASPEICAGTLVSSGGTTLFESCV